MSEFDTRLSVKKALGNTSSQEEQSQPNNEGLLHRYQQFRGRHPAIATVAETAALYGANKALQKIVERYGKGLRIGHGRESVQRRIFENYPVAATAIVTGPIPVFEELFHRKFVSDWLDHRGHKGEIRWDVGIPQAAVFAASPQHLGKEAIPVPLFLFGLHAWRTQRDLGYRYAVLSHMTYNALAATDYILKAKNR
jgi:hypothetical protein